MPRSKECGGKVEINIQEFIRGSERSFVSYSRVKCSICPFARILQNITNSGRSELEKEIKHTGSRIIDRFCLKQSQFENPIPGHN